MKSYFPKYSKFIGYVLSLKSTEGIIMNNELKIFEKGKLTIDSREVAEMMGKPHNALLVDIEGRKDGKGVGVIPVLLKGNFHVSDYFIESSYKDGSGKINKCYLVTKMGCEILGNKQQGEKGILFSIKYVEKFNIMEEELNSQSAFRLPSTYKEALMQLVEEIEAREKVELENKVLGIKNHNLTKTNQHQKEIITGLVEDVDIYKKKDIVNRVIKRKGKSARDFSGRYNEMYKCFTELFHIDLKARCEGYNMKQSKKKDELSVIKYAEKFNYIDGLYTVACKLYETEVDELLDELRRK